MKVLWTSLLTAPLLLSTAAIEAKLKPTYGSEFYGVGLCHNPKTKADFHCVKVKRGQTWKKMFPDERERNIVQKINRTDTYLYAGRVLAIPNDLKTASIKQFAPFPYHINPKDGDTIIVDQNRLAWGAYNSQGDLVRWGPISSGRDFCADIKRSCNTMTGIFYVFHKKDKRCKSRVFPVGRGGSVMPYCMFFYKGFALHGSNEVLGRRGSHGCVRLFTRDAKWLNENFIKVAGQDSQLGTRVIIQKLSWVNPEDNKEVKHYVTTRTRYRGATAAPQKPVKKRLQRRRWMTSPNYKNRRRR